MKDRELLVGIKKRDENCYELLMDKYMRYVAAVIAKVGGQRLNSYDVEEICSGVFITIWLKSEKINLKGESIKTYLAISARNSTLNVLREREKRREDELDENVCVDTCLETSILLKQENLEINKLISTLPDTDHEIIVRRYFYEEKVKDIAKKLGINEKAVSARIARSKDKLKQLLGR